MYDILFIDDKFKEIKDTYSNFQGQHIRCFYSDGENYLPKNDKEKLPFKNLKYISLDLHLENRGITQVKNNKNALSTLASVIKSFISNGENITIIVNSSFLDGFNEKDLFKYLDFDINPTIKKEEKKKTISLLHKNADDITKHAHQETLRNVVIREAIEVENLIYTKVQENFKSIVPKLSSTQLKKIKKFDFKAKIQLYKLALDNNDLDTKLNTLRELRNNFAHDNNLQQENLDLLNFLEQVENYKSDIINSPT